MRTFQDVGEDFVFEVVIYFRINTCVCLTGAKRCNLNLYKVGCDCCISLNLVSQSSLRAVTDFSSLEGLKQMKVILIQRLHSFFPD